MPSHMLMRCGTNTTARVCRTVKVILSEGELDPTEKHFVLIRLFLDTVLYSPIGLTFVFVGYTKMHTELLLIDRSFKQSNSHPHKKFRQYKRILPSLRLFELQRSVRNSISKESSG